MFDECEDGFCVRTEGPAGTLDCTGTCVAFRMEGQTCDGSDRCADGLYCIDGECAPGRELGEDCDNATCEVGLSCALGAPQTCRDPGSAGAACDDEFDCLWPGICAEGVCSLDAAEGEHCRGDDSCQDGLYCHGSEVYEDMECEVPLAMGATCDDTYDQCEDGFACSNSEPRTCVPELAGESETCGPWGCEAGLWCDTSESEAGVCRSRGGEGDECVADGACESGLLCMDDDQCHPVGEADEPCAVVNQFSCVQGLFCDRETNLCKPPRGEDETCNAVHPDVSCQEGLYCACLSMYCPSTSVGHNAEDVCAAKLPDGESCLRNEECTSGFCSSALSECAPPPATNCSR